MRVQFFIFKTWAALSEFFTINIRRTNIRGIIRIILAAALIMGTTLLFAGNLPMVTFMCNNNPDYHYEEVSWDLSYDGYALSGLAGHVRFAQQCVDNGDGKVTDKDVNLV
ncbi:MAG: hypothetical protein ACLFP9_02405 [Desulfonatronovibrio sp.]